MSLRLLLLIAALTFSAGCSKPVETVSESFTPAVEATPQVPVQLPASAPIPVEEAVVAAEPLPVAVEAASETVQEATQATQEAFAAVLPDLPPAETPDTACTRAAAALIVRWEVTSKGYYDKRLRYPIWPRGASGVTWGIGYDGGHQTARTIRGDWSEHTAVDRLARTAGITGKAAQAILSQYRDIPTEFDYASRVFETRALIEYLRIARRVFGNENFDRLPPNACAALVSLVYNRGGAMSGDSRREMRAIRDVCIPGLDLACIAAELRSMGRLWRGTVNEKGLVARREAEAILTLK